MRINTDPLNQDGLPSTVCEDANMAPIEQDTIFPVLQHIESRKSAALTVLSVLAVSYSLYFAAEILIPIALAIYLNLLLSPAVRALHRMGIASGISALIMVALLVWSVAAALSAVAEPAQQWITEAPQKLHELRAKFTDGHPPLAGIKKLSSEVNNMAALEEEKGEIIQKVVIKEPGVISQLLSKLPTSVSSIGIVIFLTLFLLASNVNFSRKCTSMCRSFAERRRTVMIFNDIRNSVSNYLLTITCINAVLGLAVTGTMYLLGFEDPWLWGIVAGALNFIPYVGPLITTLLLAFVGFTIFPDSIKALISPLMYLGFTIVEGQIITPLVVGHRLELNPVAVFLFLIFWGWIWGPIGMLLAIPILVSAKVILENIPSTTAIASLLSK